MMPSKSPTNPQALPFEGWIGVAQIDVTPPVGIYARQWGAAKHEVAQGVHRALFATVITLQQTSQNLPLVLIGLDGPWWQDADDEWRLRGGLLEALGLQSEQLVINLSHTHAGGSFCEDDADKAGGHLIAPYMEWLRNQLIAATREALQGAELSTLSWGSGWCDLAQNRDLPDADAPASQPRRVCGWNPDAPADAPADGTVLVGRVSTLDSRTRAVIVNYACHPTTLAWQNSLLSPDWVGAMRETVENEVGGACLFLQGASGELAPREQYTGDTAVADRHGRQLGFAVLSVLAGMPFGQSALTYKGVVESGAPLAIWEEEAQPASTALKADLVPVELALKVMPTTAEILTEMADCNDPVLKERLRRKARIRKAISDGNNWSMPLWCWRIGEAVLIAGPHEAYSALQTELRTVLAPHPVLVLNVSNGSVGYLPPAELYQENIYAVWQSPFAQGSLERVVSAAKRASIELLEITTQESP